jgi:8-hydroxy-5-deazaflavin:NADPH oxidoreductase
VTTSIGILGSGVVGKVLAAGFAKKGYLVGIGSRSESTRAALTAELGTGIRVADPPRVVAEADVIVLAVKGSQAEAAVRSLGPALLAGKVVLDATNPIADAPPVDGVLQFFTGPNESLMERLQRLAPQASFVKCFSCVGNAHMVDPKFAGGPPTMFICGNSDAAKKAAESILQDFGWEWADMGGEQAARAIEPLCQLWCIPGLHDGSWNHAFKLLKS